MFQSWFKLVAAGADFANAGLRTGEALIAADDVIRDRSRIIADAIRDPVNADYRELGKLVPEKMAAMNDATADVMRETAKIWRDTTAYYQAAAHASWGGNPFTFAGMSQSTDLLVRSMGLYAKALDPFHSTVTGNARRLRKKGKKA